MKHVCIAQNDDGTVMVGEMPAEMMEGMDDEYLQSADNLDAALAMAKDMLVSNPEEDQANESAFQDGYKQAGGVEELMGMGNKGKMGGM